MTSQDLLITPVYFLVLLVGAYFLRPYLTDRYTRSYFIPALLMKFFGAISLGLVYQFYYGGGDTFTYFHLGSQHIWLAFMDDPTLALSLIFGEMDKDPRLFSYWSEIYNYGDAASYAIVRLAGLFDLFTYHTYTSTALLFAVLSFSGIWMTYSAFQSLFPEHTRGLAWVILFFPSLVFWGSGILKDPITIAAVGWMFWSFVQVLFFKKRYLLSGVLFVVGFYTLYVIKIYILLSLLPALAFWLFQTYKAKISNVVLRWMVAPAILAIFAVFGYYAVINVGEENARYSVDRVLVTAEETARWNYEVSERSQGSGYTLGDYDFSPQGLALKFVPAVFTTFFRPFVFEAGNPFMLMSGIENAIILFLFVRMALRPSFLIRRLNHPVITFSFLFAVLFAFAVGVTTYNYGSLVRYKIPMLPFLLSAVIIAQNRLK